MWEDIKVLYRRNECSLVNTNNEDDDADVLEKLLAEKSGQIAAAAACQTVQTVNYNKSKIEFLSSIADYEKACPRLHHSASILKFWDDSKVK